jgi:hypothetical protein
MCVCELACDVVRNVISLSFQREFTFPFSHCTLLAFMVVQTNEARLIVAINSRKIDRASKPLAINFGKIQAMHRAIESTPIICC